MKPGEVYRFSVVCDDGRQFLMKGHAEGAEVSFWFSWLTVGKASAHTVAQTVLSLLQHTPTLLHAQWHIESDASRHQVVECLIVLRNLCEIPVRAMLAHYRQAAAAGAAPPPVAAVAAPAPAPAAPLPAPVPAPAEPAAVAAAAPAAELMDFSRQKLLLSLESLLTKPHMFRRRPGTGLWLANSFDLEITYPATDGVSSHTCLISSSAPDICHSVYTHVQRYGLPVPPKMYNRLDIAARGIDVDREPTMKDVLKEREISLERRPV